MLALCLTGISLVTATAQISWTVRPQNLQFIARNPSDNRGMISFRGSVANTGYTSLEVRVYRNGSYLSSSQAALNYSGGVAPFSVNISLTSGRYMYSALVILKNSSTETTAYTVKGIAVGDAYLISGQSNSVANRYNGFANPVYQDSLIRSFGSSSPGAVPATTDTGWYVADGDGLYNKGCIGQWGLVMARKLLDSLGVPVCIVNAGVGGTPITFHQKSVINPYDPNTNYGRMLTRSDKSGLRSFMRGILWFQGESDGANAALHDSLFRVMHLDWLRDYPAIRKIYIVQVRSGCGAPTLQLREKQRLLGSLNKCVAFTANGLNTHDGCHYWFTNGYEQLGLQLYRALASDVYGRPHVAAYFPLHPLRAWYSKGDRTEICVEFQGEPLVIKTDTMFHTLFRLEGGSATITSGRSSRGRVYLTLSRSDCNIRGVSYDGLPGNRPWVKTTAGVALMSFYDLPVLKTYVPESIHACESHDVMLGRDSIPGYTYQWTGLSTGRTSSLARPVFRAVSNEKFRLVTSASSGNCKADSTYQMLFADSIPVSTLPEDTACCYRSHLRIRPTIRPAGTSVSWTIRDSVLTTDPQLNISSSGKYILQMVSPKGCFRSDTLVVNMPPPLVSSMADAYLICTGQDTMLTANKDAVKVRWNQTDTARNFRPVFGQSMVVLLQTDINGCMYADTARLTWHTPRPFPLAAEYRICPSDSLRIALPDSYQNWLYRNEAIEGTLLIYSGSSGLLTADDHQGCRVERNVRVSEKPVPLFRISDTAVCEGESLLLGSPLKNVQYLWSNGAASRETSVDKPGYHWLKLTNQEGCSHSDTFQFKHYPRTRLNSSSDTFFCTGDSFVLRRNITHAQNLWVNGAPWTRNLSLTKPVVFRLTHFDLNACKTDVTLRVFERTCLSSISGNNAFPLRVISANQQIILHGLPEGIFQIRLIDVSGRVLLTQSIMKGGQEVTIAVPGCGVRYMLVQIGLKDEKNVHRFFTVKTLLTD